MKPPTGVEIRAMTIADHGALIAMMGRTPGVCLREADAFEPTRRYLDRNPGLSFAAWAKGEFIGCAMAGHDGRRGYLQHVMVEPSWRRLGIAQALVSSCLEALKRDGIEKVHLEVLGTKTEGKRFWAKRGWSLRDDIARFSLVLSDNPNA